MPEIDLLFTTHNRLEYTKASLRQLVLATDWSQVRRLVIHDDGSTDGTRELMEWMAPDLANLVDTDLCVKPVGGPVAAMNHYLDHEPAEAFVKIDNDVIVPPGWLQTLLATADAHPSVDCIGFEPGFGQGLAPCALPYPARALVEGSHIGGVGLFRTRIFEKHRPVPNGFFGMTEFMRRHARCGWLSPNIPQFLLDHLGFEPWRSLAASYVSSGWSRSWPAYSADLADYWSWWTGEGKVETAGVTPPSPNASL